MEGFLRYKFGGLIHGGAYIRNFAVYGNSPGVSSLREIAQIYHLTCWSPNLLNFELLFALCWK